MLEDIAAIAATIKTGSPAAQPVTTGPAEGIAAADPVAHLSPSLQLDAAVGIVVIQFRSESGAIELSIPSQQQMQAYQADPLAAFDKQAPATHA